MRQVSVAKYNSMGNTPDDNTFAASCGSSAQSLQEICEQSMLLIFHSQVLMNDTQAWLPEAHTDVTSISYTWGGIMTASNPTVGKLCVMKYGQRMLIKLIGKRFMQQNKWK